MAGEVNGVNGTGKVEDTKPKGEQRVVEQKAEEMFDYGSENDIGDGLHLHSAIEVATGAAKSVKETIQDGKLHSAAEVVASAVGGALETVDDTPIGRFAKAVKNKGFVQATKDAIHNQAEENKKFKKEHPYMIGYGFLTELVDNIVNGGK